MLSGQFVHKNIIESDSLKNESAIGWIIHYFIGGDDNTGVTTALRRYDKELDQWQVRQPMNYGRKTLSAETVGGLIYVVGGTYNTLPTSWIQVYDPINNTWQINSPKLGQREGLGTAVLGSRIYVIAGNYHNHEILTMEEYSPYLER